jgi:hypothetical protein
MKALTLALALFPLLASADMCPGRCVNTSGNPAYNALCDAYGAQGLCSSQPNICTMYSRPAVSRCVNVTGNPAYNALCDAYGAQGLCSSQPNICAAELRCAQ